jgi:hypothetical protein
MKPYPIKKPDADVAAALGIRPHVARDWRRRGSIPAQYFHALSVAGLADLEDLAAFAAVEIPERQPVAARTSEAA